MKILMLCGYFAPENEREVLAAARASVEFSANQLQQKLIRGFRQISPGDVTVVSAPFLGSYPNASGIFYFRRFANPQSECTYVPFLNVWGLRNFSRSRHLKRAIRAFVKEPDPDKLIVVYNTHTPFLEAAVWAKGRDRRIRICLYAPDLPQYMNLSPNRSKWYDFCKTVDIARMHRLMEQVDCFSLLTRQMYDKLPVGTKPWIISEGLVELPEGRAPEGSSSTKTILYAGKLEPCFGIPELLAAFSRMPDPELRLVLCGSGPCLEQVRRAAEADGRILALGQLPPQEAQRWMARADVLVNPRIHREEYTKYAFPSKVLTYLTIGKPVVSSILDGMPGCYRDFLWEISPGPDAPGQIAAALRAGLSAPAAERERRHQAFLAYARANLTPAGVAARIIDLAFGSPNSHHSTTQKDNSP